MSNLHVRPPLVNDHFSYATATTFLEDNFTILQLAIDCIFASRDHLAHGLMCTFAKCPTLTHTTQSMEELLVFCLAIQIFNLELAYYKFSSSSSLWISSRKRPPARRPATKLSPD